MRVRLELDLGLALGLGSGFFRVRTQGSEFRVQGRVRASFNVRIM